MHLIALAQNMSYQYGTVACSNIQIKASNTYSDKYVYHKAKPIVANIPWHVHEWPLRQCFCLHQEACLAATCIQYCAFLRKVEKETHSDRSYQFNQLQRKTPHRHKKSLGFVMTGKLAQARRWVLLLPQKDYIKGELRTNWEISWILAAVVMACSEVLYALTNISMISDVEYLTSGSSAVLDCSTEEEKKFLIQNNLSKFYTQTLRKF